MSNTPRRPILGLGLCFFSLLLGYPLVRSVSTAIFLEAHGAAQSPHVWLLTVFVLVCAVSVLNKLHYRIGVEKCFVLLSILTSVGLIILTGKTASYPQLAYPLYILKEVYIVLLVHLTIARMNALVSVEQAKKYYGPFGALGSLGGLLGGVFTHQMAGNLTNLGLIYVTLVLLLGANIAFWNTRGGLAVREVKGKSETPESPLRSLKGVQPYVACVIGVIILSQFLVNAANFQFNMLFDQLVSGVEDKTRYLGLFYSVLSAVSLLIQLVVVPLVLRHLAMKSVHHSIVGAGALASLLGFVVGGGWLWSVAGAFLIIKAIDYSLFSAAKEILYFPLSVEQKYGAKYLGDMVFYRFAKGLISFVLIFIQGLWAVNGLILLTLGLWVILLIPLFRLRENLLSKENP